MLPEIMQKQTSNIIKEKGIMIVFGIFISHIGVLCLPTSQGKQILF